jgi:hypothetical protein
MYSDMVWCKWLLTYYMADLRVYVTLCSIFSFSEDGKVILY